MTHSCATWLIHMSHDSYIWDMTHTYDIPTDHILPPSFSCEKKRRDTTHTYETWLIHVRDDSYIWVMTHPYNIPTDHILSPRVFYRKKKKTYDSFIWDMTHSCATWLIHMSHDSYKWDMTHTYDIPTDHILLPRVCCEKKKRDTTHLYDFMIHSFATRLTHMRQYSFIWHSNWPYCPA